MTEDSLKKRYIAKLLTNIFGLLISLITQSVIPRGLGPRAYGDFDFLSNFFLKVVGFFDMGTSTAFYIKLSQRPNEFSLVSFYFLIIMFASLFFFVLLGCTHSLGLYSLLLPDQESFYIYIAAIWGILTWIVQVLNKMTDAYGMTVSSAFGRILQKIFGLLLILLLFFTKQLSLTHFFFIIILSYYF